MAFRLTRPIAMLLTLGALALSFPLAAAAQVLLDTVLTSLGVALPEVTLEATAQATASA